MNLHSLKNNDGARRARTRVGRGRSSGLGKTSGRGHKGQKSRTGYSRKIGFEGGQMTLIRRLPKVGFTNPTRTEYLPVNVGALAVFADGAQVTPATMGAAGLCKGRAARVKVLGAGDLKVKLTVQAHAFSAAAKLKIEAAGGHCETIA